MQDSETILFTHLDVQNVDLDPSVVKFIVSKIQGGKLVDAETLARRVIFTKEDISARKIAFIRDASSADGDMSFDFTVTDGVSALAVGEYFSFQVKHERSDNSSAELFYGMEAWEAYLYGLHVSMALRPFETGRSGSNKSGMAQSHAGTVLDTTSMYGMGPFYGIDGWLSDLTSMPHPDVPSTSLPVALQGAAVPRVSIILRPWSLNAGACCHTMLDMLRNNGNCFHSAKALNLPFGA